MSVITKTFEFANDAGGWVVTKSNTTFWEVVDSNNTDNANMDFNLTYLLSSSFSNYYDMNGWIACMVYQRAI